MARCVTQRRSARRSDACSPGSGSGAGRWRSPSAAGSVLVKRFSVPPEAVATERTPGDLRAAVAREAARHVPFHLDSLEFDYEGPRFSAPGAAAGDPEGEGRAAVVFGAAPREIVLEHCRGCRGRRPGGDAGGTGAVRAPRGSGVVGLSCGSGSGARRDGDRGDRGLAFRNPCIRRFAPGRRPGPAARSLRGGGRSARSAGERARAGSGGVGGGRVSGGREVRSRAGLAPAATRRPGCRRARPWARRCFGSGSWG